MITFGKSTKSMRLRQIGAALLCLVLLYFAGGHSVLHQHNGAPDTICDVCQSLRAPVLTVTFSGIASAPQITGWHDSAAIFIVALNEFSILRAGARTSLRLARFL
jgi:hypothetical protein